jgi:hypothetical protein
VPEKRARKRYHHRPDKGEAHGPRERRSPHERIDTPATSTPEQVAEKQPEPDGMGSRPHARGERVGSRPNPARGRED